MLRRQIIAVCSQIHTKDKISPCGQNLELFNVILAVYTVNTGSKVLNLCYKIWSDNSALKKNRCFFSDQHKTHKFSVCEQREIF